MFLPQPAENPALDAGFFVGLNAFPSLRKFPGDHEKENSDGEQYTHLRPELLNGFVIPEYFREPINGPAIDSEESSLLQRWRHQKTWEHAAAYGGHGKDKQGADTSLLRPRLRDASKNHAEICDRESGADTHH